MPNELKICFEFSSADHNTSLCTDPLPVYLVRNKRIAGSHVSLKWQEATFNEVKRTFSRNLSVLSARTSAACVSHRLGGALRVAASLSLGRIRYRRLFFNMAQDTHVIRVKRRSLDSSTCKQLSSLV
jgi:hypothetical protein